MKALSPGKIIHAKRLRKMKWSWEQIAKLWGMNTHVLRRSVDPEDREHRNQAARVRRAVDKKERVKDPPAVRDHVTRSHRPPDDVLAEREMRLALPRTLTATFFGDPPPGYSALDRRT